MNHPWRSGNIFATVIWHFWMFGVLPFLNQPPAKRARFGFEKLQSLWKVGASRLDDVSWGRPNCLTTFMSARWYSPVETVLRDDEVFTGNLHCNCLPMPLMLHKGLQKAMSNSSWFWCLEVNLWNWKIQWAYYIFDYYYMLFVNVIYIQLYT